MACLLLMGSLPGALSESEADISLTEAIQIDAGDLLTDADAAFSQDAIAPEALALPQLEGIANATMANASQPIALTVSKSVIKSITVRLIYQIVVPGKTIRACKSSKKSVATVSDKGLIRTLKTGKVKIAVYLTDGTKLILKLKVYGKKVPTGVTINEGRSTLLYVREKLQLSATVSPSTASQEVTWKSSASKVAYVNSKGVVIARKAGTAVISAITSNDRRARFKVTVKKNTSGHYMISHAMGGIGGYDYSNCLEAFKENYREGYRIFEVDFQYTSDGKLVLWHKWDNRFSSKYKAGYKPTYAQFMNSRIYDKYTPMDVERLLKLMDEYPNARIVTDTKYTEISTVKKQFNFIVSTARELGISDVLDRFIVEVYNYDMFNAVKKIYPFKEYMMILYKAYKQAPSTSKMKSLAKYCKENGIKTIAMNYKWWKSSYAPILESYGIESALHTVNDASDAEDFFEDGVTALFTD